MELVFKKLRRFNLIMGGLHLIQGRGNDPACDDCDPKDRRVLTDDYAILSVL